MAISWNPADDPAEAARTQLLAYGEEYLRAHPKLLAFWRLEYGETQRTNAEIAALLGIDERTVRKQRQQSRLVVARGDAETRQELQILKEGDVFSSLTVVENGDIVETSDTTLGRATGIPSRKRGRSYSRQKATLRPDDW